MIQFGTDAASMSTGKVSDFYTEFNMLNEILSKELKHKDESIELLRIELDKARQELMDKAASLHRSKEELGSMKSFESKALSLFAESEQRFHELDLEIEKRKESEKKMFDSFTAQTKELQQTKMELIESKREIECLKMRLRNSESSSECESSTEEVSNDDKENHNLQDEIRILRNELKLATEAEENSTKAMDDLAFALKEVATESNQIKQNLASKEEELDQAKEEIEQYKLKLKAASEKYDELVAENELCKNTMDRLRIEAEDSVLAWSGKEAGFVECIRRAEEDRNNVFKENLDLMESVRNAETLVQTARQENHNLRDILKQALNEANVSKEAARIATAENSQLKDALQEKQKALEFISQENEALKMNEAAAFDSIKELKRMVSKKVARDPIPEEDIVTFTESDSNANAKAKEKEEVTETETPTKTTTEVKPKSKSLSLSEFGFSVRELRLPTKITEKESDDEYFDDEEDCDSLDKDPLKGSIFDTDSPVAAGPAVGGGGGAGRHRRAKSSFEVSEGMHADDMDVDGDGGHYDDDSGHNYRKKKALLRRFGDMLMRRSYHHRKEPSLECAAHT